ncbi:cytochrome C oxidase subunit IV family protein [Halopseudomonas pelagia]|uniref:cytochrome C oxidase subunit IV family protein n=1 Tax=Halopseudomonas pelagia TaxID=553151 RepID=UPI0003A0A10A|nr:cytochrome C oxidase subunit IV family protein [Halopseudomonas pelagia]
MTHRLTLSWLSLLALTLLGWWLGHQPTLALIQGEWLLWAVLVLSAVKGQWLIDHFMGMKTAPMGLRLAVSGWLLAVLAAMALFL